MLNNTGDRSLMLQQVMSNSCLSNRAYDVEIPVSIFCHYRTNFSFSKLAVVIAAVLLFSAASIRTVSYNVIPCVLFPRATGLDLQMCVIRVK
jgi:hypothetical protein